MKRKFVTSISAAILMFLLILDSKTAISGAQEGIKLCIITVIPSLFPFILLSIILTANLTERANPISVFLGKILRIPKGSEMLFLIGVLGGYPSGAQSVAQAFADRKISKEDARRMLGFCSNAGPAFLFGMTASCFSQRAVPWLLWAIHILSALVAGVILPGGTGRGISASRNRTQVTLSQAMERSLVVIARLCGWIVIFRVISAFLNHWFLCAVGDIWQIIVNGFLELTIGCTSLSCIPSDGLRFILCAAFLGFGGICVTMQTASVTKELGLGMYLPGKLLQCVFSIFLAIFTQAVIIGDSIAIQFSVIAGIIILLLSIIIILYRKKIVAFQRIFVYNQHKKIIRG